MIFSENWARILPDLSPLAAGYFVDGALLPPFSANLHRMAANAFTARWQKAKLRHNQCRPGLHLSRFLFVRKPHAQSPFQLFILPASHHLRRAIRPCRRPYPTTSTV
ncbi:hypothetical protein EQV93_10570 [Pseudomonas sp. TMW22091]|uniref:Uncharacterized protein n=1 Tax=Pseudomonas saxonica TaxID=2600598 RepID=A0A5C5PTK8_9PSED|nr:hypothetical protein [Pseudomonas sp. TMW22091]TWR84824.1 hypothetical protein FJD37_19515 [Pseudomonas saxonica]